MQCAASRAALFLLLLQTLLTNAYVLPPPSPSLPPSTRGFANLHRLSSSRYYNDATKWSHIDAQKKVDEAKALIPGNVIPAWRVEKNLEMVEAGALYAKIQGYKSANDW
jgi:hypothetical protein